MSVLMVPAAAAPRLVALLNRIGGAVEPAEVERMPSACCGGCSG